jgi:transposase
VLAKDIDYVIGVDTHKDSHSAALVNSTGGVITALDVTASEAGYRRLLALANRQAVGRRTWAVEGTGSYGSGLATFLVQQGEQVLEIERPRRPRQKPGNSDQLDAIAAAREALAEDKLAMPRRRGAREALRILLATREGALKARTQALCQLHALVVGTPEVLRCRLRRLRTETLVSRCAQLRRRPDHCLELQIITQALRSIARRAHALGIETAECEKELVWLVGELAPALLEQPGLGPICAAQIICAWSHHGRLRSEAAFAALAGVAPIPASFEGVIRHRLNRGGDRQLNRALHTIVMWRMNFHPETKAYTLRRRGEGKNDREVRRCLKRHLARRIFRLLKDLDTL